MAITASLTVTPSAPAAGAVVTAAYSVSGAGGTSQVISFTGTVTAGGVQYPGSTGSFTLPGTPGTAVTYAVPACNGLAFSPTSDPAVFTATVPAAGTAAGTATVSGRVTAGSVPVPVSAVITLPGPSPVSSRCYFGVWDDGSSYPGTSWAGVQKFAAAPVKSATQYLAWLGPFPAAFNALCAQNGAVMYLNLEPWNTWNNGPAPAMPDIAAGKYDSYLTTIGQAVKAGGHPVLLTFAHEMNGNGWYPWQQSGGVTPAQWVAAWNHVTATVKAAAGGLASFVWCPNNVDVGPCAPYWPGTADVVGMDAYLNQPVASQTYATFVKQTVDAIGKLDGIGNLAGQVWNAETGVAGASGTRSARIAQFAADMRADGRVRGLTWFNEGSFLLTAGELGALTTAVNAWNAA